MSRVQFRVSSHYRAMLRRAGIAIEVVCMSVRLSVPLRYCDHIHVGWSSSKIILRLISLWFLLSADTNMDRWTTTMDPGIPGNVIKFGLKPTPDESKVSRHEP